VFEIWPFCVREVHWVQNDWVKAFFGCVLLMVCACSDIVVASSGDTAESNDTGELTDANKALEQQKTSVRKTGLLIVQSFLQKDFDLFMELVGDPIHVLGSREQFSKPVFLELVIQVGDFPFGKDFGNGDILDYQKIYDIDALTWEEAKAAYTFTDPDSGWSPGLGVFLFAGNRLKKGVTADQAFPNDEAFVFFVGPSPESNTGFALTALPSN
jgi:hypothetical protein